MLCPASPPPVVWGTSRGPVAWGMMRAAGAGDLATGVEGMRCTGMGKPLRVGRGPAAVGDKRGGQLPLPHDTRQPRTRANPRWTDLGSSSLRLRVPYEPTRDSKPPSREESAVVGVACFPDLAEERRLDGRVGEEGHGSVSSYTGGGMSAGRAEGRSLDILRTPRPSVSAGEGPSAPFVRAAAERRQLTLVEEVQERLLLVGRRLVGRHWVMMRVGVG